jgi:hypothetical protein
METLSYNMNPHAGHLTVQSPVGGGVKSAFAVPSFLALFLSGGDTTFISMFINSNNRMSPNEKS